jgi:16S rRNA processing protein RimM
MTDDYSFPADKYVLIGKISKAHGLKGELKIIAFSGESQSITQHKKLILVSTQGQLSPAFNVLSTRAGNREVITRLEGVTDRNQAEEICGCGVLVEKDDLPDPGNDSFYLHELEGIEVRTEDDRVLGKVTGFFDNGIQDILVVKGTKDEFLIPLIPGMIVERNMEVLIIAPPPGLLEINSDPGTKGKVSP